MSFGPPWKCSKCGRLFANRNQSHSCSRYTLREHLAGKSPCAIVLFRAFAPEVAIVSELLARRVFGDEEPVGKTFRFNNRTDAPVVTVVGVVHDLKWEDLKQTHPVVYVPLALAPSLRSAVHQLGRDVGITDLDSGQDLMSDAIAQPRSNASLFVLFAALALVIAGVGIYGTLSYTVAQRMRELGIRMALGAQRGQVFGMVIRQGMGFAAVGMLVGGLAAFGATRSLTSLLFGVKPTDPSTFAMALLLLALVALAAVLFPSAARHVSEPNERLAFGIIRDCCCPPKCQCVKVLRPWTSTASFYSSG